MRYRNRKFRKCPALTIIEIIIALAIITIIFAAVLPQFRVIYNGWDSRQAGTEVLQNGRVLIDHINRNLSKAVKITAVEPNCIQFLDNDSNTYQYDINPTSGYVEFGSVGNLSDLAGPVSLLTFTCYDACDLNTPLSSPIDVNSIRFVKAETTLTNSAALGQNKTFTAWAYLRTNAQGSECWQNDDIGEVGAAGSATESDGTWTINASGADIGSTADEFHYVYQSLSGDGQIIARVVSIENTNSLAKAGVMIRETLTAGSKHAMMVVTPSTSNGTIFQWRTTTGGSSDNTAGSAVTAPYWVRLVRSSGDTFTGYESPDGSAWTLVGSVSITMSTDVYIGLAVTSHNDGVLCTAVIGNVAFSTVAYEGFTEAKVSSDSTSITISTPGSGGVSAVTILGSWVTSTTHAKESGTNRALVFIAHAEEAGTISLNSVTYGGQTMTKVIERIVGTNPADYVVAYILNEAGVAAATSGTFSPTWSTTPDEVSYASVFLQNVNQTTLIGASASNSATSGATITTAALATSNGDMVIDAADCGNVGDYTVNLGFTEAIEQDMATSCGTDGYKSATGANETPSVTFVGTMNRQVLIGFVVQTNEAEDIEGDLLIAAVATDGDTSSSLEPSDEDWNKIDVNDYSNAVTLGAWWKLVEASEPSSYEFTWTGGQQAYGWMMRFSGHNPTPADTINASSAGNDSNSTPTSPGVTTTVNNCLILRLGAFDDDDINTLPEPGNPGLPSHTAITMDKSGSDSAATVAILGSWATGLTHAKEAGTNRALIFIAHAEHTAAVTLNSVSYGGQSMTKVIERSVNSGSPTYYGYVVAYILDEAGVAAASSNNFIVTWSTTPESASYASVFLSNVNQTTSIGASASNGTTTGTDPISTSALATNNGDRVIDAVTCGNLGSYTMTANGFTEGTDQAVGTNGHTGATGYKSATGAAETPSADYSATVNRQVIIGFVVQHAVLDDTVSGGAGYVGQSSSGDSGTSNFSLTASEQSQMLTIAIAPADTNSCEGSIQP